MTGVTLTICTTCRQDTSVAYPDDAQRPGAQLLAAIHARDIPEGVTVQAVECLSACNTGCAVTLSGGPERWSYVYGNLDPEQHADDILQGAGAYAQTTDGLVPWRARPVVFRKQSVARIPPFSPKPATAEPSKQQD